MKAEDHFDKLLLTGLFLFLMAVLLVFAFWLPSANGYKEFVLQAAGGVLGALLILLRSGSRAERKEPVLDKGEGLEKSHGQGSLSPEG
jgi:hypothetical protein